MGVISVFGRLLKPEDFPRANASDRAKPGEVRWVAIEDMDPLDAKIASDQQRTRATPEQPGPAGTWAAFEASRSSDSFPWPTKDGQMLPLHRGATSDVPGLDAQREREGK